MPFKTATPKRAINPTPAEILKGIPLNNNANTPPMALMGIAVKINKVSFTELKVKNNNIKIKANATGKAICNLADASLKFSKVPP